MHRAQEPPIPAGQHLFDIDPFSNLGEAGIDLNSIVGTMERQWALERSKGVRSKAAQILRLNRTTLLEKMKKMKIEREKS